jgi:hypothetical protein
MEPVSAWEPIHEKISYAEMQGKDQWRVSNIRDFVYTRNAPPVFRWSTHTINSAQVTGAHFYMLPLEQFGKIGRLFAHTCVGFSFPDTPTLIYSIEMRQPRGCEYNPTATHENVCMFATLNYFQGFRHIVRGRGFSRYPLLLTRTDTVRLLETCLDDVCEANQRLNPYHAITNQCTTELIRIMNRALEKPISWHPGWHLTGFTHYVLAKHNLINLSQREYM